MAGSYFDAFPKIRYNGELITNITLRAKLMTTFSQQATNFYPYSIKDTDTPDSLAFDYYGNQEYAWLVMLVNDMIDPYYDWPVSSLNFDKYIAKKYGSVEAARDQIAYYKQDPTVYYISVDTNDFKTEVEYDIVTDGPNWKRIEVDTDIIRVNSASQTRAPWLAGDVDLGGDDTGLPDGSWFKPTLTYISPTGSLVYLDSEITLYENFDASDWTPVTCYEEEQILNENKRYIRLLNRQFLPNIDRTLKEILNA